MLLYEKGAAEVQDDELVTEYVFNLINLLKKCQKLAVENMVIACDERKI